MPICCQTATVAGRYHGFQNSEDRCAIYHTQDISALMVSDGCGSLAFAAEAAEFQTTLLPTLTTWFERLWADGNTLATPTKLSCLYAVQQSLKKYADKQHKPYQQFAATMVAYMVKGSRFLTVHIGDGAIYGINANGSVRLLSEPDNGKSDNETTFLCCCRPEEFRVKRGFLHDLSSIVLSTDGLTSVFQHNPSLVVSLSQVQEAILQKAVSVLAMQEAFTCDDCTLAVATLPHHRYPAELDTLTPRQKRLLQQVDSGVNPVSIAYGNKAKRRTQYELQELLQQGYLCRNCYGHWLVYRI